MSLRAVQYFIAANNLFFEEEEELDNTSRPLSEGPRYLSAWIK